MPNVGRVEPLLSTSYPLSSFFNTKPMADQKEEQLKVYEQLCTSYRAIDDFRAKLLGFLPLVSGSGVFLLLNDAFRNADKGDFARQFLRPIGLFGFVITLGLFF